MKRHLFCSPSHIQEYMLLYSTVFVTLKQDAYISTSPGFFVPLHTVALFRYRARRRKQVSWLVLGNVDVAISKRMFAATIIAIIVFAPSTCL